VGIEKNRVVLQEKEEKKKRVGLKVGGGETHKWMKRNPSCYYFVNDLCANNAREGQS